jgi:tetratricopeptide (TPR) repeat protein
MQELLELAFDDPVAAQERARHVVESSSDPAELSYALQSLGIVLRESGRVEDGLARIRDALRAARRTADAERVRDVRATYAGTLVLAGRTAAGLRQFDIALDGASDVSGATVLARRATVLTLVGRHRDARQAMHAALDAVRGLGDPVWEARILNNLAHIEVRLGHVDSAEQHLARAEALFGDAGSEVEMLDALANRGEIALLRGDLPSALRWYAAASGQAPPHAGLAYAWANALLAAGLAGEAIEMLRGSLDRRDHPPLKATDLRLALTEALLAAGDAREARAVGEVARREFDAQERSWFERRARFAVVRARAAMDEVVDLGGEARLVADLLDQERADEAPLALALAGRLAQGAQRRALWRGAASYRTRANGLVRASAYLAGALDREDVGDRGGVLRACSAGLDAIDEHRRLMGSSELRAVATTHGRELTAIVLRHAAHDPRTLLRWSERTRATALAQPPATSDAATVPASLAALRDNGRRLAEARQAGEPTGELEKERLRLERAVRAEHHTQSAVDTDPQRPAGVEEIVAGVGDGCLVELVDVDGALHVLVVHDGRVRRQVAGTTAEVADLLGPTAMLLRRAARGRPANTADIGRRLQEAILGDAVRLLPDGPVVLAPTARLHGLAWSLLPVLNDRAFGIVPSAGQWLRATSAGRPERGRTTLVVGPDLESGGAEVPVLAARHPDAVLLDGGDATVAAVLDALDGAGLAHLATHGRFRADSPLFSALDLADGPLTVHDLERLRTAPYRVVLSACESGVLAPVGAQELLGLAAALFSIGTAGLVSSVGEVNDAATADLMVGLHDGLAAGTSPAAALLDVRQGAAADPVAAGTAAAFVALGV